MQTTVTVKGQVTIPKAVRERAGIKPGMRVEVGNDQTGKVVVTPVAADEGDAAARKSAAFAAALGAMVGIDRTAQSTDEFMASIREPVPL